jgi:hypothetical protein
MIRSIGSVVRSGVVMSTLLLDQMSIPPGEATFMALQTGKVSMGVVGPLGRGKPAIIDKVGDDLAVETDSAGIPDEAARAHLYPAGETGAVISNLAERRCQQ